MDDFWGVVLGVRGHFWGVPQNDPFLLMKIGRFDPKNDPFLGPPF